MTLSEYTLYLSKKGFDISYRELNRTLKIYVTKRSGSMFVLDKKFSTTIYSAEMQCRSQSEYEQLIIERVQKLINQKFTEPIDTTMREIKELGGKIL